MKDYKHIEKLLERFYNAETSETEEQMLKNFFFNEEVPSHLQTEKEIFLQLDKANIPEGMEKHLGKLIDEWEFSEKRTPKRSLTFHLQWIASIAASLLLLVGMSWYASKPKQQDTCATPEEAYAHTEKALLLFSEALNKGIRPIEEMGKTSKNIRKQINKLNNTEL